MDKKCVVCDKAPEYPTACYTTGFIFCEDCYSRTDNLWRKLRAKKPCDLFASWLLAISKTRASAKKA